MRPTPDLSRLLQTFTKKNQALIALVARIGISYDREGDRRMTYVALEGLNNWTEFCRAYYLSYLHSPVTGKGRKIAWSNPTVTSPAAAISGLWMVLNPTRPAPGVLDRRSE